MDLVGQNNNRGFWPKTPLVIMRYKVKTDAQRVSLDFIIKNCIADSFDVNCFRSVYANEYIVTLGLNHAQLLEEAARVQFLVKL